jgi:rhamnosyltransferase
LKAPKVIAIVVALNPKESELRALLDAVVPQVQQMIVIDNGSDLGNLDWMKNFFSDPPIEMHSLIQNYGVATAQNQGIALAKKYGAQYVLLLDDDSIPPPELVSTLMSVTLDKEAAGIRVGSVGPAYQDPTYATSHKSFVDFDNFSLAYRDINGPENIVSVAYTISSGSLISMATLDAVGAMKDELFVDYVDIEWGLRARHLGFQSFGVCNLLMVHHLGYFTRIIMGKSFRFHNPLRHYYQFRNAIWLYRQPYLSMSNKIGGSYRLLLRFAACAILAKDRQHNLIMMLRGVAHGVIGKLGKF